MFTRTLVLTLCVLLLPAALAATPLNGPAPVPVSTGEETCDSLGTICVSNAVNATVTCTDVDLLTVTCGGSVTWSATGRSPAGLPGHVYWRGNATCGGVCNDTIRMGAGSDQWTVTGDPSGTDSLTVAFANATFQRPLIGCVTYRVSAQIDAMAATFLQIAVATAPTAFAEAAEDVCALV